MKKRMIALWLLAAVCLFGETSRIAWWSVLYPRSVYESGAGQDEKQADEEQDNEKQDKIEIKWKLAEWIVSWFQ